MTENRQRRYYIDGSTVRKLEAEPARKYEEPERRYAEPARKEAEPVRKKKNKANKNRQTVRQKDRRWVDELKYGMFLTAVVICAVGLCIYILKLNADVKEGKIEVAKLQNQLDEQLSSNAEYSSGLDSMTDLDEIYKIATTELGMVYSEPGQTLYYSKNSDDYVVQYKDIPEAK
jgi:cell division protein FtsL